MKFRCVKSSNNSYWNSTILYNYQFVFIETISVKCQTHFTFYIIIIIMKFMCVKSSNNSYSNSTILYHYQFVFIETISAKG